MHWHTSFLPRLALPARPAFDPAQAVIKVQVRNAQVAEFPGPGAAVQGEPDIGAELQIARAGLQELAFLCRRQRDDRTGRLVEPVQLGKRVRL